MKNLINKVGLSALLLLLMVGCYSASTGDPVSSPIDESTSNSDPISWQAGEPETLNEGETTAFTRQAPAIPARFQTSTTVNENGEVVQTITETPQPTPVVIDVPRQPYVAKLSVTERIVLPSGTGQMLVAISAKEFVLPTEQNFVAQERTISSRNRRATITPVASAFEVIPEKVECIKLDKEGSESKFELKPLESAVAGSYQVSANIVLFDSENCSDSGIPKTTRNLSVTVEIDRQRAIALKANELGEATWKQFMKFWVALLALMFGGLLFVFRSRLNKLIGRDGDSK